MSERIVASLSINQLKPRQWDHGESVEGLLVEELKRGRARTKELPTAEERWDVYIKRSRGCIKIDHRMRMAGGEADS